MFKLDEQQLLPQIKNIGLYEVVVFYTPKGKRVAARYSNKEKRFIELSWITSEGIRYYKL